MKRLITIIGVACAVLLSVGLYSRVDIVAADFTRLYAAGTIANSEQRARLYDAPAETTAQTMKNNGQRGRWEEPDRLHPPFEVFIYRLLAHLPYGLAFTTWYFLNSVLLISIPIVISRRIPQLSGGLGLIILAGAAFFPATVTLFQGQNSILLLALLCGVFLALDTGRDTVAGLLLAGTMFKFQIGLALLVGILALRGRRILPGFFLGCGALLAIAIATVGPAAVLQYPSSLLRFSKMPVGTPAVNPPLMPNLRGFVEYALSFATPDHRFVILIVLSIALLTLQFCLARHFANHENGNFPMLFSLMIVIASVIPFHEYVHDLTILLLPFYLSLNEVAAHSDSWARLPLLVAAMAIWVIPFVAYALLMVPMTFAVVVVFGAALAFDLRISSKPVYVGGSPVA